MSRQPRPTRRLTPIVIIPTDVTAPDQDDEAKRQAEAWNRILTILLDHQRPASTEAA